MKFPILLLTFVALTPPLLAQEKVVVAPFEGVKATITLRAEGGMQVTETRRATLASGVNRVELSGLSPQYYVSTSVQTRFLGPGPVEIFEQSQRNANGSPDLFGILYRHLGEKVTILRDTAGGEKPTTGTLLQVRNSVLLDTPDGILIDPKGTYLVPRDDQPLYVPSALVLGVNATASGDYRVESNYLQGGGKWSANYRATQNGENNRLDLRGFAQITFPNYLNYKAANLILEPQKGDGAIQPIIARPLDLSSDGVQLAFFNATIAVAQRNVYRATGEFTADSEGAPRLVLRSLAPIGTDLPSGALALYRERTVGPPEAITATIAATSADQILQIALGEVPGMKVVRRIAKTRQLSPVTTEYTVELTLSNTSKIAQPVEIIEDLPINPTVGEADPQPVVDEKNRTLSYAVTVAPEATIVLRYVVESKTE